MAQCSTKPIVLIEEENDGSNVFLGLVKPAVIHGFDGEEDIEVKVTMSGVF